jgi:hypothetical protein
MAVFLTAHGSFPQVVFREMKVRVPQANYITIKWYNTEIDQMRRQIWELNFPISSHT